MTFLVSSALLRKKLSVLNFNTDSIRTAEIQSGILTLTFQRSGAEYIKIEVSVLTPAEPNTLFLYLQNNNYEEVYKFTQKYEDLPLLFDINHNTLKLKISF